MDLEVKNGEIRSVRTQNVELPLNEPVPVERYPEVEEDVERLTSLFDIEQAEVRSSPGSSDSEKHPWSESELREFLDDTMRKEYRHNQAVLLQIVAEHGEMEKSEVEELFAERQDEDVATHSMDGFLSSITRRSRHFGQKESIIQSEKEDDTRYYRMKDEYREIINDYFSG